MQKLIHFSHVLSQDFFVGPSTFARFQVILAPAIGLGGGFGPVGLGPDRMVWRGDHSFSASAVSYSLSHFLEPHVQAQHPDWSASQIRVEARREMAIALWENHSFSTKERKRQKEIQKEWNVVETSPGVKELTATFGNQRYTLHELWAHTYQALNDKDNPKTYNPAAYNAEEAEAQFAIEKKLVSGEAAAALIMLSDPDGFRYGQIWKSGQDGTFHTEVIDLGLVAGKDFLQQESVELLKHVKGFYEEKNQSVIDTGILYPVILLKEGAIRKEDVETITYVEAIANTIPQKEAMFHPTTVSTEVRVISDVTNQSYDATKRTADYAFSVGVAVTDSVKATIQRKIQQYKENVRTYQTTKKQVPLVVDFLQEKMEEPRRRKFVSEPKKHPVTLFEVGEQAARAPLIRFALEKKAFPIFLKKQHENRSKETRIFVRKPESKNQKREKEGKRFFITARRVKESVFSKDRKKKQFWKEIIFSSKKVLAKTKDTKVSHLPEKRFLKKEFRLWKTLRFLARFVEKRPQRIKIILERKQEKKEKLALRKRETKQSVQRFAFLLVVWSLLHIPDHSEKFRVSKKKIEFGKEAGSHSYQWVLLTIISLLAAIREQGMKQAYQIKPKKKFLTFPTQGVIFALAS